MEIMMLGQPSHNGAIQPAHNMMGFCRNGDVAAVKQLIADGTCAADFSDHEGLTPLHVRAPNIQDDPALGLGHVPTSRYG